MSQENIENLILEHLRELRGDIQALKTGISDIRDEILSVRKYLHAIQGDALRREQTIAGVQVAIERINSRLDISDA